MKNGSNNEPLVRIGQGDYARDYHPGDFEGLPEGASVAIVVLIFVFVLGFVLGAWLW